MAKKKNATPRERKNLKLSTKLTVLTEAGYRCAVPTCRQVLTLNIHHIWEVSAGGGDDPANLIALCPNCHALYHNGTIPLEAIWSYKAMLVAIGRAFDLEAVDLLLFLSAKPNDFLVVSGDGALHFARLAAGGLASIDLKANNNYQLVTYAINITDKGKLLVEAWTLGDPTKLKNALGVPMQKGSGKPL